jgi:Flp pilus assembly protein TadD
MFPEALVMASTWRERSVEDPFGPDMAAGSILGAMKRYPEALQRMDRWKARIANEAKANPGFVEQYAQALAAGGRISDAKDLLWPRLETDEGWALSCLRVAEHLPAAEQDAWIARIEPILLRRAQDRVALGRVLYAAGTRNVNPALFDRAITVLQPALDDTQTRAAAALFLAGAYEAKNDSPEAIRHYRIAVEKFPNDPIPLNNLAYLLSSDPKTTAEAVTFAKRAVEVAESTVQSPQLRRNFKETLGVCYFRNKQCSEAEHIFREALALDVNGLESMVGLAESLQCLQKPDEAKSLLQRIDARPKQEISKELQPRIDDLRSKLK